DRAEIDAPPAARMAATARPGGPTAGARPADGQVVGERTPAHEGGTELVIRDATAGGGVQEVETHVLAHAAAAAGDGLVPGERAVQDGEHAPRPDVEDATAVGVADRCLVVGHDAPAPTKRLVVDARAANHRRRRVFLRHGADRAEQALLDPGVGPVADEGAAGDGEGAAVEVGDRAALGLAAEAAANGHVVGQHVVGEGEPAADVEDAAAAGPAAPGPAGGDGQPGDGDGEPFADVEDPAGIAAADGQQARARPLDVQAPHDVERAAGQGDGPAREGRGEGDRVSVAGAGNRVAQGPGPLVEVVQYGQGAEH